MSDHIVKRLRDLNDHMNTFILDEAADRIEQLEEALRLADAALSGANMNMAVLEKKVRKALERNDD